MLGTRLRKSFGRVTTRLMPADIILDFTKEKKDTKLFPIAYDIFKKKNWGRHERDDRGFARARVSTFRYIYVFV